MNNQMDEIAKMMANANQVSKKATTQNPLAQMNSQSTMKNQQRKSIVLYFDLTLNISEIARVNAQVDSIKSLFEQTQKGA